MCTVLILNESQLIDFEQVTHAANLFYTPNELIWLFEVNLMS